MWPFLCKHISLRKKKPLFFIDLKNNRLVQGLQKIIVFSTIYYVTSLKEIYNLVRKRQTCQLVLRVENCDYYYSKRMRKDFLDQVSDVRQVEEHTLKK